MKWERSLGQSKHADETSTLQEINSINTKMNNAQWIRIEVRKRNISLATALKTGRRSRRDCVYVCARTLASTSKWTIQRLNDLTNEQFKEVIVFVVRQHHHRCYCWDPILFLFLFRFCVYQFIPKFFCRLDTSQ